MARGGRGSCLEGSGGSGDTEGRLCWWVPEELRPHSHSRAAPVLPSDLSREREDWYPLTALIPPHPLQKCRAHENEKGGDVCVCGGWTKWSVLALSCPSLQPSGATWSLANRKFIHSLAHISPGLPEDSEPCQASLLT